MGRVKQSKQSQQSKQPKPRLVRASQSGMCTRTAYDGKACTGTRMFSAGSKYWKIGVLHRLCVLCGTALGFSGDDVQHDDESEE